ncbi:hypothetical protein Godav_019356 [Gossypium davidsonii]|uniref:Uncharacterized protein n=1 Tax=Gossypium davidsonii TaxID=34287 RepID=A0A7J8R0T2_GOSDV|nr:hypothetical protein [Gossypium davidsonii]
MVNVIAIAKYFEATIGDHPKIKLREIQRRDKLAGISYRNLLCCGIMLMS